jgi:hypothetical protein
VLIIVAAVFIIVAAALIFVAAQIKSEGGQSYSMLSYYEHIPTLVRSPPPKSKTDAGGW